MGETLIEDTAAPAMSGQSTASWTEAAARVFPDGGELGALCRAKDWSATPLGPVEGWPQSLKTAVSIALSSSFPMIVLWGPDLIQIYNDSYRSLMGSKHPGGLGQSTRTCWPEVWHINEPIYPRVFKGETVSFKEAVYPLASKGYIEDYYLTLCYHPIRDETGSVGGVFVTIFDVTGEVRTRTERDTAMAEIKAERSRLHEVFMQAPAIIAVLEGPDHVFTVANSRYKELAGGRDVVGKPLLEALPEVAGQGFVELLDQVRSTKQPYIAHDALVKLDRDRDGIPEDLYVDFIYQPLSHADGSVFGVMAHAVETTEQVLARKQAEQRTAELLRLTQALAETNRELDQFAYVASHDLKAPLRGISSLAQWIEEDLGAQLSESSRKHLELMQGRVHRMEALINGILTYSRAGRLRADPEPVATAALLREVLELLVVPANVRVDLPPDLPTLTTERVPLQQVFMNLLGNAIKYGGAHRPDARVAVAWRDAGDAYKFSVQDNGPGIAPEFHERVWEMFQTLERRDKVEGTGIGLSVVKKLIESRGGQIGLESAEGAGATFWFTWPKGTKLETER
jgi:signal transduction histidine kinase